MVETNFSVYDSLSIEELSKKMCELKNESRLTSVVTENRGYFEVEKGHAFPVGLDYSPEFHFVGRAGDYDKMSFDEATDILRREKDLKTERYLVSKGITRQDVEGFLEYLVMSTTLEKKLHPEVYEVL